MIGPMQPKRRKSDQLRCRMLEMGKTIIIAAIAAVAAYYTQRGPQKCTDNMQTSAAAPKASAPERARP